VLTEVVRGDVTYYLLGTAHVSKASVAEVRETIERMAPEVVCVELDRARHDALTTGKRADLSSARRLVREGKLLFLLAQLTLASYQRRIGKKLGVKPGAEMLEAIAVTKERGATLALIDRDIDVTLRRAWSSLSIAQRAMLGVSVVVGMTRTAPITQEAVEQLKDPAARAEVIAELSRALPEIKAALIDERDAYMVSKMIDAGRDAHATKVLAVVGAAHVPGMAAQFDAAIDRGKLEQVPPSSLIARTLMRLA
jgi:pheromone shutdown-related protein TraB